MMVNDDEYSNGTLKNELNITDKNELQEIEYRITNERALYLLNHPIKITSSSDLIKIHSYLFRDIYPWAGKVRNYELAKGNTQFMYSEQLSNGFTYIDQLLQKNRSQLHLTARDYAALLDSVNYLHPFREGNGRTTRLWLQLYASQHNQLLIFPTDFQALVRAEHSGNINQLANLLTIQNLPSQERVLKSITTQKIGLQQLRERINGQASQIHTRHHTSRQIHNRRER